MWSHAMTGSVQSTSNMKPLAKSLVFGKKKTGGKGGLLS